MDTLPLLSISYLTECQYVSVWKYLQGHSLTCNLKNLSRNILHLAKCHAGRAKIVQCCNETHTHWEMCLCPRRLNTPTRPRNTKPGLKNTSNFSHQSSQSTMGHNPSDNWQEETSTQHTHKPKYTHTHRNVLWHTYKHTTQACRGMNFDAET